METIFVLNCGSSSIKFQVIEPKSEKVILKGLAENLRSPRPCLRFTRGGKTCFQDLSSSTYPSVLNSILQLIENETLIAVGHRVVHGGETFRESVKIDPGVLEKIEACNHLAPLHNPVNALGIKIMQETFPDLPHIAVFDTSFHQTMPKHAYLYALPHDYYEKYQVRRYGFHGTSHRFVVVEAAKELKKPLEETALISAHLGNGCSVCAVKGGKSVDTSMGFTPLEGLVMGQRSGDLDPSLIPFLAEKLQMSADHVISILNKKSGLLGLSGISEDMRLLLAEKENRHVQIAIEIFCYRLAKYIASYIVPLKSLDAVIFTGGIGENAEPIRKKVLDYLTPLRPKALVIPTNEELVIARDAAAIIRRGGVKHTLLMVPLGLGVGLSTVSMGLIHSLESHGMDVTFLNPFESGALEVDKVQRLLSQGKEGVVIESIIAQVETLPVTDGVLVIQGILSTQLRTYASLLNNHIAKALDAEVIFVVTPGGKSPSALKEQVDIASKPYGGTQNPKLLGCIINKIGAPVDMYGNARIDLFDLPEDTKDEQAVWSTLSESTFNVLGCVPWERTLMAPRVSDVADYLQAEVISEGRLKEYRVKFFVIAGATIENISHIFKPDVMIITPSDRSDTILAACLSYLSGTKIAGILLTGGYGLPSNTMKLCHQAIEEGLPILSVKTDSLRTGISLQKLNTKIPEDDVERRTALQECVSRHINQKWVAQFLSTQTKRCLSPPAFRYQLIKKARHAKKRIILPEGEELRIIQAAAECMDRKIAHIVLLGNRKKIRLIAENSGIKFDNKIEVLDPEPLRKKYLQPLLTLRKHKGLTEKIAIEALQSNIVIGTLMLAEGEVDGLVAGATHTTAHTVRPALMLIKTQKGVKRVSSIFFMCLEKQVLVYGDCAVNQNPNIEELADIAIQSADSAKRFGIEPRVAMISYSTGTSGTGEDVEKVKAATQLVKKLRPDLIVDGPLQYDAAFSPDVASKKAPDSPVAGKATVYVFPDLNTANTTYKAVQRSADVLSIGPILQGLNRPVNDLSRGAHIDDIVYTIAITALQSI